MLRCQKHLHPHSSELKGPGEAGSFTVSTSQNHKTRNQRDSMFDTAAVVVLFFSIVETLFIFIGNIFTIYVFWRHRTRLKRTSFLLINLAVADLLVALVETIVIGTSKIPLQFKRQERDWQKYFRRISNNIFLRVSIFPRTHFSGTCIRFDLAAPPSSFKHQKLHLQCHFCVGSCNIYR